MRGLGLSWLWVLGRTSDAGILDVPRSLFIAVPFLIVYEKRGNQ